MDEKDKAIKDEAQQAVAMIANQYFGAAEKRKITKDVFKEALRELYLWARASQCFLDRCQVKNCVDLDFTIDEVVGEMEVEFEAIWKAFYRTKAGRSSFAPISIDQLQRVNTVREFFLQTVKGARPATKKD